jgi:hypothetical protein
MKNLFLFLLSFFYVLYSSAQQLPAFEQLRYNEDYSILKNDTLKNYYSRTKYSPLNKNGNTYLSIGGDVRQQYFYIKNQDWGDAPEDKDGYVLSRLLTHADFHAGKYFRTYVEIQSSLANGQEYPPPPIDENQLDLHQAFVDLAIPFGKQEQLVFRAGRQEFLYGTQRLVSVKEGTNNRQAFDAVKLMYSGSRIKADAFFSHHVRPKQGIFDDKFDNHTKFWGGYAVINKLPAFLNLDLYYFGLWKTESVFDDGVGGELRHSVGTRIWKNSMPWVYDFEALYQWGKFGEKHISAWTISSNTTYTIQSLKLKPQINLKADLISGDKNYKDGKLNTFNPLFPRGAYFGLASLIGPVNLIDIHPSIMINLTKSIAYELDYDAFWRYSKNDGLYGPTPLLLYSGKTSKQKFIGNQLATFLTYNPNQFFSLQAELTWFKAGTYLKDVSTGKNILFTAFTAQCKF